MPPDQIVPCGFCRYDLRGQPADGVCPECGRPVAACILPAESGFTTYRAVRWTRRGVALWVVALVLPALGRIAFTLIVLASPSFWSHLSARMGWGYRLWWSGVYAWFWGEPLADIFTAVAVLMIAMPRAASHERVRQRLGLAASALAGVAMLHSAGELWFSVQWGLAPPLSRALDVTNVTLSVLTLPLPLLGWMLLTARLDRRVSRRLRRAMNAGLAVCGIVAIGQVWFTLPSFAGPPGWWPAWWWTMGVTSYDWSACGETVCQIGLLLVLWAYVRRLNAVLRCANPEGRLLAHASQNAPSPSGPS